MQTVAYMNVYTESEVHTMLPVGDTHTIQKCRVTPLQFQYYTEMLCMYELYTPVYAVQADAVAAFKSALP